jgi:hypothetical protein
MLIVMVGTFTEADYVQALLLVIHANLFAVDSLEHYEVPFFGRLANSFVEDE